MPSSQILEFITTHHATIAILIKTDVEALSLSTVEELHLIVSLCTRVLPYVEKEQLVSAVGYADVLILTSDFAGLADHRLRLPPRRRSQPRFKMHMQLPLDQIRHAADRDGGRLGGCVWRGCV